MRDGERRIAQRLQQRLRWPQPQSNSSLTVAHRLCSVMAKSEPRFINVVALWPGMNSMRPHDLTLHATVWALPCFSFS